MADPAADAPQQDAPQHDAPERPPAAARIVFTPAGVLRGARELAPLAFTTVGAFALAFGVAARQGGLELGEATVMTALVFAGASQFAALGVWSDPLPVLSILVATAAVNARFLLMGAALRPWVHHLPGWKLYPSLFFLADPVWAKTLREFERDLEDAGYLLGGGLVFWFVWVGLTIAGYQLGSGIGDPARWGIDALMPAFFAVILTGMWRGPRDALPWVCAGASALAASLVLPGMWHVLVGGIAGGLAGALRPARGRA
jgi:predicted branched-subunit amino acid permease